MIRQAISCDICGAEKKQTNHWFVASEQAGELRVCGWNSRNRLRTGSKHLCGQTCLHKLMDEYMARTIASRVPPTLAEVNEMAAQLSEIEMGVTTDPGYIDSEIVRRLPAVSTPAAPALPSPAKPLPAIAAAVPMQPRPVGEENRPMIVPARIDEAPNYNSRHWRAEAWERERQRESRAAERNSDATRRRKSS